MCTALLPARSQGSWCKRRGVGGEALTDLFFPCGFD
jgi:hypothetical protein